MRPRGERVERLRSVSRSQGDQRKAGVTHTPERVGPVGEVDEGYTQGGRHRRAHGFPVQRIATTGTEQHGIRTKGRGIAKDAAHVVGVRDVFKHHDKARRGEDILERPLAGPFDERQAPAVNVVPRDPEKIRRIAHVHRDKCRGGGQHRLEVATRGLVHQHGPHGPSTVLDDALDDHAALGDEETAATCEI